MRSPEVVPDSRINLKKSPMPKGISAVSLSPTEVAWSSSVPGYEEEVPSWVAKSTLDAFTGGKADSPYEVPKRKFLDIRGKAVKVKNGRPLNPFGRTGRNQNLGLLWRFGASFAADGVVVCDDRVLLGKRIDNGLWALPGGFNDPGEALEISAKREVFEETNFRLPEQQKGGVLLAGPLVDIRNGDHSWMETIAFLYVVSRADVTEQVLRPKSDELEKLEWWLISQAAKQKLHAGHERIIQLIS